MIKDTNIINPIFTSQESTYDSMTIPPAVNPNESKIGSPEWVVETWRKLYYLVPSPYLKQRVEEAERWLKQIKGA